MYKQTPNQKTGWQKYDLRFQNRKLHHNKHSTPNTSCKIIQFLLFCLLFWNFWGKINSLLFWRKKIKLTATQLYIQCWNGMNCGRRTLICNCSLVFSFVYRHIYNIQCLHTAHCTLHIAHLFQILVPRIRYAHCQRLWSGFCFIWNHEIVHFAAGYIGVFVSH